MKKKKLSALIALILCCALLTACTYFENIKNYVPHFADIVYSRPDLETLRGLSAELKEALSNGERIGKIMAILDECYEEYDDYDTMYTVAEIRSYADLTDEYYAGEYAWCDENYYIVQQLFDEIYFACGASELADELEERYFWEGFAEEYSEGSESFYSDESVALMQRESELLSESRALLTAPTVKINGVEVDYYSYLNESESDDEYYGAQKLYYEKYNPLLAEVYIELVRVRNELASVLGFESYEQFQYAYNEREYEPAAAHAYIADIKEHIVPLYTEAVLNGAWSELRYDALDETALHDTVFGVAKAMGGAIYEAFSFMTEHGMYDARLDANKASLSFQSYLRRYDAPFLFIDPYGDTTDILTFSHEFGHYADAYINYNAYETVDVSECFSQAMEYLVLCYSGEVLSEEERENLVRMKMLDTLDMYVQQASFAEFERIVYAAGADALSAEYLNELSLELAEEYGYCEAGFEYYYAMSWIDVTHFFEVPFYVITYPVSNDIAMQIYELELAESGKGLEKFLEMLPRTSGYLFETIDSAGLESPFEPGRIQKVAEDIRKSL